MWGTLSPLRDSCEMLTLTNTIARLRLNKGRGNKPPERTTNLIAKEKV